MGRTPPGAVPGHGTGPVPAPAGAGPPTPQLPADPDLHVPLVRLKPHEDRRVRRGHLWIFSNEVAEAPDQAEPGGLAGFLTHRGELLGVGFYHPGSLIAGRLLDRRAVAVDAAFLRTRLARALALRQRLFPDPAYRWVHGESDDLPGLVIDRYGDAVVIESHCAGMDRLLEPLLEALRTFGPWSAIVLRNDASSRKLEGLDLEVRTLEGTMETPHWFTADGLALGADLLAGQKTGYFFDQRPNRAVVASLAKDRRVLDVFCHTGGFGLMAARSGAASVASVDESEPALALARANAERNGFADRFTFHRAEAMDWLARSKDLYDIVVVDPPRFAPSRKVLPKALAGYIRLNTLALRRVTGGGFLATSSCSQHVDREAFRQVLARAAQVSGRKVQIVHQGGQGPDHPIRPTMPETDYLKFALLHVL